MYIIVSNDPRVPIDLQNSAYEKWSVDEFCEHASTEEGLDIDEGLFYDVSVLTEELYEALRSYSDQDEPGGIKIRYYRFDDQRAPKFAMYDEVIVYSTLAEGEDEEYESDEGDEEYVEPFDEQPTQSVIEEVVPDPVPVQPAPQPYVPPQPEPQPYIPPAPAPQPYVPPVQPAPQPYVPPQETYTPPQETYQAPQYEPPKPAKKKSKVEPAPTQTSGLSHIAKKNLGNMLLYDDFDADMSRRKKKQKSAKVFLFGSSKGGTGKTFTCLATAYRYALSHPTQKVALADFDIIDGQIGITINKLRPTMLDFYTTYYRDNNNFTYLNNCKATSDHFSPNIDFYLAPSQDIPKVTNDKDFWNSVFALLISNYDVVFFDSGIDYLGKPPISALYQIANKIIITCNPSINSTKSVIKQLKTLSGQRVNQVFSPSDNVLSKVSIVLTRVYATNPEINELVESSIQIYAPVITRFGSFDEIISEIQWFQRWNLIDETPDLYEPLDKIIAELEREDDDEDDE